MKYCYFQDTEKTHPVHNVRVANIYSKKDAQVMHITLQPGEELVPHKTPVDVFFYVLEGSVTVYVGDESNEYGRDMCIESPAHIRHFLGNNRDERARVLVVKTPNPST
ncbi:cupin domain-containing protein [Chitinivibrio alkaliphilus]|uniref:Cupin type-2 domain-containing protein n=1 Tax=Chitinivibrio alkaliphilus ACht1 TaxID=1313304 RepID=U7D6C2_9BACT|nr:cupin domain-containing protein [Chitinivibrio alkaliphilus]ERP31121.1 hypothetical protein CALK_2002 [Chitinivibrio alkaliphilus ACht1]